MSWPLVKLKDCCTVTMGQAPKGDTYNTNDEGHALIAGAGDFGFETPEPKKFTSKPTRLSAKGDIILCIRATIGDVNWSDNEYCLGRGVAGLKPKADLDALYLWYFIKCNKRQLESEGTGSTFKQVSRSHIEHWEIPLPPLPEQKRIAAILDKADQLRQKRQQAIDLADEFLRSVFLDMFGDPVTNPKGWEVKPLGELLDSIDSGWSPKCTPDPADVGQWGVLKLGAVTQGVYLDHENKSLPLDQEPKKELEVKKGDLLFTRKNTYALVAATALVHQTREKLLLPDLIFRLKLSPDSQVLSEYLWGVLSHTGKRKKVQSLAGGAAGSMPNISKANLKMVEIPIPPFKKQQKFKTLLKARYNVASLGSERDAVIDNFFNSLSQKAFAGEL